VVLDIFNRQVVGWSLSARLTADLALNALRRALFVRRPHSGLIFHSDQGVQYASEEFRAELKQQGFVQSMSRKGDCYDNAVMESFFGTLKRELVGFTTEGGGIHRWAISAPLSSNRPPWQPNSVSTKSGQDHASAYSP
jgi:transposase InsO family protein